MVEGNTAPAPAVRVPLDVLDATVLTGLRALGHPEPDAQTIKRVLLYAQLRGNNQGVVKLAGGTALHRHPHARPARVVKQTSTCALIDGGQTFGILVMDAAATLAATMAGAAGVAVVGTFNTSTTTGALGCYADQLARRGLVALVLAGSMPVVAYAGAAQPVFGTNPIAVGLPADADADADLPTVVLDMATSAIAYYGVVEASKSGRALPPDVAVDPEGRPTTDPAKALAGAILPFDRGHKGSGLGLVVEVLTGALVGAATSALGDPANWGNLIIAIDPDMLAGRSALRTTVSALVRHIKSLRKQPNVPELLVPGERGNRQYQAAMQRGYVELDDQLWTAIQDNVRGTPLTE